MVAGLGLEARVVDLLAMIPRWLVWVWKRESRIFGYDSSFVFYLDCLFVFEGGRQATTRLNKYKE